jgi:hypothetical protein
MPVIAAYIIGSVLAIGGTIVAYILIIPEKKRAGLNKFLQVLHDIFTFKSLLLEKIIRVLYVLSTLSCVFVGFFMIFSGARDWSGNFQSMALPGFLTMVLGPIAVRLSFEAVMMFILLVKNTIEINNKFEKK